MRINAADKDACNAVDNTGGRHDGMHASRSGPEEEIAMSTASL
jgi:hypothetical protein